MPYIEVDCQPSNQARLRACLERIAQVINGLPRYTATATASRINFTPILAPVSFIDVSPTACSGSEEDFLDFLNSHPPESMVDAYAKTARVGRLSASSKEQLTRSLEDQARTIPDKLQVLRNAFGDIHPYALPEIFKNIIFPWFFSLYPQGRVLAVTTTQGADDSEFLRRNLVAASHFGLESWESNAGRRMPYNDLLPTLTSRIQNVAKIALQYNGPYLDGFCLEGILTFFVFVPDESIHRRSIQTTSLFDCLAPFSTVSASPTIHTQDGYVDTVRAIHDKRPSTQIEEWLRHWLVRADSTLDRLYNLSRATDAAGRVDFDEYLRRILQFERIFFEVTWSCSMLDQFLRKIIAFAVVDKVTSFMRDTPWCQGTNQRSFGTQKYVAALTREFIVDRLPQMFQHPFLTANATAWLSTIHTDIVQTATRYSYPNSLINQASVDWGATWPHLSDCGSLPGNAPVVSEDVYSAQVIRAIRNTHHGFSDLYSKTFAVLSTTSGVVSEELSTLLPFLAFAMLDSPDEAINSRW